MGYNINEGSYGETKEVKVKSYKGLKIIFGIILLCSFITLGFAFFHKSIIRPNVPQHTTKMKLKSVPKSQLKKLDSYTLIMKRNGGDNTVSSIESADRFGKITKLNSEYYISIYGKARRVDEIIGHSNYDSFVSTLEKEEWEIYRKVR